MNRVEIQTWDERPFRDLLASPKDERQVYYRPHALFSQEVWYNVLHKHAFIGHVVHGLLQSSPNIQ